MNIPEQDEPVYWFVTLEKSVDRGDFEEAARAVRELKRLGVDVRYRPTKKQLNASGVQSDVTTG